MKPSAADTVTVVIPAFRATATLARAVESALAQAETAEVLLVEDGSGDGTRAACDELARRAGGRVRVLGHSDGRNRGPAAARNLGVREARHSLIAFLDADDWYLEGRFSRSVPLLLATPGVDGVYEAVGLAFADEVARERWAVEDGRSLIGLPAGLPPERLRDALLSGGAGNLCTDGVLLRREAVLAVGGFDETLRTFEDTGLWWKLASRCRLVGGELERAVAVYERRAASLSAAQAGTDDAVRQAAACWRWSVRSGGSRAEQLAFRAALAARARAAPAGKRNLAALAGRLARLSRALLESPGLCLEPRLWRGPGADS